MLIKYLFISLAIIIIPIIAIPTKIYEYYIDPSSTQTGNGTLNFPFSTLSPALNDINALLLKIPVRLDANTDHNNRILNDLNMSSSPNNSIDIHSKNNNETMLNNDASNDLPKNLDELLSLDQLNESLSSQQLNESLSTNKSNTSSSNQLNESLPNKLNESSSNKLNESSLNQLNHSSSNQPNDSSSLNQINESSLSNPLKQTLPNEPNKSSANQLNKSSSNQFNESSSSQLNDPSSSNPPNNSSTLQQVDESFHHFKIYIKNNGILDITDLMNLTYVFQINASLSLDSYSENHSSSPTNIFTIKFKPNTNSSLLFNIPNFNFSISNAVLDFNDYDATISTKLIDLNCHNIVFQNITFQNFNTDHINSEIISLSNSKSSKFDNFQIQNLTSKSNKTINFPCFSLKNISYITFNHFILSYSYFQNTLFYTVDVKIIELNNSNIMNTMIDSQNNKNAMIFEMNSINFGTIFHWSNSSFANNYFQKATVIHYLIENSSYSSPIAFDSLIFTTNSFDTSVFVFFDKQIKGQINFNLYNLIFERNVFKNTEFYKPNTGQNQGLVGGIDEDDNKCNEIVLDNMIFLNNMFEIDFQNITFGNFYCLYGSYNKLKFNSNNIISTLEVLPSIKKPKLFKFNKNISIHKIIFEENFVQNIDLIMVQSKISTIKLSIHDIFITKNIILDSVFIKFRVYKSIILSNLHITDNKMVNSSILMTKQVQDIMLKSLINKHNEFNSSISTISIQDANQISINEYECSEIYAINNNNMESYICLYLSNFRNISMNNTKVMNLNITNAWPIKIQNYQENTNLHKIMNLNPNINLTNFQFSNNILTHSSKNISQPYPLFIYSNSEQYITFNNITFKDNHYINQIMNEMNMTFEDISLKNINHDIYYNHYLEKYPTTIGGPGIKINATSTSIYLNQSKFINLTANNHSQIFNFKSRDLHIQNCTFEYNGVQSLFSIKENIVFPLLIQVENLTLVNVEFLHNRGYAGAGFSLALPKRFKASIDEEILNKLVMKECIFKNNTAWTTGGGFDIGSGQLSSLGSYTFSNNSFINNIAYETGMHLRLIIEASATFNITNNTFIHNDTADSAEPQYQNTLIYIYSPMGNIFIINCTFQDIQANNILSVQSGYHLNPIIIIKGTLFQNIYSSKGQNEITLLPNFKNTTEYSSLININGIDTKFLNCKFDSITIENSSLIKISKAKVRFNSTNFTNFNSSYKSDNQFANVFLLMPEAEVLLLNTKFDNINLQSATQQSSAIITHHSSSLLISETTFTKIKGLYGSVINCLDDSIDYNNNPGFIFSPEYAKQTTIQIANSSFEYCNAIYDGGCIYLNTSEAKINLINITFFSNEARSGGAIYYSAHIWSNDATNLDGSNGVNNENLYRSSPPYGYSPLDSRNIRGSLSIESCAFENNNAEYGGAIKYTDKPIILIANGTETKTTNSFVNNTASVYGQNIAKNPVSIEIFSNDSVYLINNTLKGQYSGQNITQKLRFYLLDEDSNEFFSNESIIINIALAANQSEYTQALSLQGDNPIITHGQFELFNYKITTVRADIVYLKMSSDQIKHYFLNESKPSLFNIQTVTYNIPIEILIKCYNGYYDYSKGYCMSCLNNQFIFGNHNKCTQCPPHTNCTFSRNIVNVVLDQGYWTDNENYEPNYQCIDQRRCIGGQWKNISDSLCAYGTGGKLCQMCKVYESDSQVDVQFTEDSLQLCRQCSDANLIVINSMGMLIPTILLLLMLLYNLKRSHLDSGLQNNDDEGAIDAEIEENEAIKRNANVYYLKLFIYFCQNMAIISTLYSIKYGDYYYTYVSLFYDAIITPTDDIVNWIACGYYNAKHSLSFIYYKFLMIFVVILVKVAIILVILCLLWLLKIVKSFWKQAKNWLISFYLFEYFGIAIMSLKYLSCVQINPDNDPNHYLRLDLNYQCYTSEHTTNTQSIVLPLVCIWLGIIPIVLGLMLCLNKEMLYTENTRDKLGVLYNEYHEVKYYYWDILIMASRISCLVILLVIPLSLIIQFLSILAIFILYLLFSLKKPYKYEELNKNNMIGAIVSLCTLISASIIWNFGSTHTSNQFCLATEFFLLMVHGYYLMMLFRSAYKQEINEESRLNSDENKESEMHEVSEPKPKKLEEEEDKQENEEQELIEKQ